MSGDGLSLGELAVELGCELAGDPDARVARVATLGEAGPADLAFLANAAYRRQLATTRAGAVVLAPGDADDCPGACLVHPNPYVAYARAATLLYPPHRAAAGVHPSAVIEPGADVHATASVAAHVFIETGARIGAGVAIGPGCVVGRDAVIDEDTRLVARVTVLHGVRIGRRCLLHPGAVIGADGFGLARDSEGWVKVPQLGGVAIGDDVEVGANTTIDRGALGNTVIGDDVRLDNQIQIAHNVVIGAHTALAAMVGVAGSTRIGANCMIAGQAGIGGHLEICDGVVLMGRAMVTASIRKPGAYGSGVPVEEVAQWRRNVARYRQLDKMHRRLRAVEKGTGGATPPEEEQ